MAVTGLFSLMATWWSSRLDLVSMDRFAHFDTRAIVPVGYAAFAFALGVTVGIVIRRTLPAMATTMVAFIAVRLVEARLLRPHLFAPLHAASALDPSSMGFISTNGGAMQLDPNAFLPNAWVNSIRVVDGAGRALSSQVLASTCPTIAQGAPPPGPTGDHPQAVPKITEQIFHDCISKIGATYHQVVTYQPASRYWGFQWYECAIFLTAAIGLGCFSLWWVRHRLT
jgi:hypothetical protein